MMIPYHPWTDFSRCLTSQVTSWPIHALIWYPEDDAAFEFAKMDRTRVFCYSSNFTSSCGKAVHLFSVIMWLQSLRMEARAPKGRLHEVALLDIDGSVFALSHTSEGSRFCQLTPGAMPQDRCVCVV